MVLFLFLQGITTDLIQAPDMLLPEALWSDAHPSAPIAYRFGTVILPAPAWIR